MNCNDISSEIELGNIDYIDRQVVSVLKCKCGNEFDEHEFLIGLNMLFPSKCPKCGTTLFFSYDVCVYELEGK